MTVVVYEVDFNNGGEHTVIAATPGYWRGDNPGSIFKHGWGRIFASKNSTMDFASKTYVIVHEGVYLASVLGEPEDAVKIARAIDATAEYIKVEFEVGLTYNTVGGARVTITDIDGIRVHGEFDVDKARATWNKSGEFLTLEHHSEMDLVLV